MSEEVSEAKASPKIDPNEKAFQELQNEFLRFCAQAGEKQFIASNAKKDLFKINRSLKKIDLKAKKMIEHQRALQAQKKPSTPDLKVVPIDPIPVS